MGVSSTIVTTALAGAVATGGAYQAYQGKKMRDEANAERDRQAVMQQEKEAELRAKAQRERKQQNEEAWSQINRRGYTGTVLTGGTGGTGSVKKAQLLGDIS